MTVIYYKTDYQTNYVFKKPKFATSISIVDSDTFTAAEMYKDARPCCLNFASHKKPGGGYSQGAHQQEEDLFFRSNLPELMDNEKVKKLYPLDGLKGIYCPKVLVGKDAKLDALNSSFEVSVITLPAIDHPAKNIKDKLLTVRKVSRILHIAEEQKQETLILGAWGCGCFKNDPKRISYFFNYLISDLFAGVFEKVIYAIPDKTSYNYKVFECSLKALE